MTREDAIKMLKSKMDGNTDTSYEWAETIRMAIKALEQESEWIPVNERLPKVADCYIVTQKIGSDLMTSASYFDGIGNWHDDVWINNERNYLTNIVAWMSLPEPYEPKDGEK